MKVCETRLKQQKIIGRVGRTCHGVYFELNTENYIKFAQLCKEIKEQYFLIKAHIKDEQYYYLISCEKNAYWTYLKKYDSIVH